MTFYVDKMYVDNQNTENLNSYNRILKYIKKKKLYNNFYIPKHDENFYNWLLSNINTKSNTLGYINDNVFINYNPINLPDAPNDWDILCLNGNILKYDFSDKNNNIYWVRSIIDSSNTFVINSKKLSSILTNIQIMQRNRNDNKSFFHDLSETLKTYVITQYFFTENIKNTVENKTIIKNKNQSEYYNKNGEFLHNVIEQTELDNLNYAPKDYILKSFPKISFIIPLNNYVNFFHNFLLISEMNYINYEIIVIDYLNYEKKIKHILKLHSNKIKLLNVNAVDYSKKYGNLKIPLGFIFNSAVKACQGDIIFPFYPDKHYMIENIEHLVKNHIFSEKECYIGKNLKEYNLSDNSIYNSDNKVGLYNMFFTQNFWLSYTFDESCDDEKTLIYKFIKDRLNTVSFYDSSLWCLDVVKKPELKNGEKIFLSQRQIDSLDLFVL